MAYIGPWIHQSIFPMFLFPHIMMCESQQFWFKKKWHPLVIYKGMRLWKWSYGFKGTCLIASRNSLKWGQSLSKPILPSARESLWSSFQKQKPYRWSKDVQSRHGSGPGRSTFLDTMCDHQEIDCTGPICTVQAVQIVIYISIQSHPNFLLFHWQTIQQSEEHKSESATIRMQDSVIQSQETIIKIHIQVWDHPLRLKVV